MNGWNADATTRYIVEAVYKSYRWRQKKRGGGNVKIWLIQK